MCNSITRDDIIKNTRGFFDGEMSILTVGSKFDGDLMKIWRDNFKPNGEIIMSAIKQQKKSR